MLAEWGSEEQGLQTPGAKGREVCGGQTLEKILPPDKLPSHKVTLTLGNSRIFEMGLSNSPVLNGASETKSLESDQ